MRSLTELSVMLERGLNEFNQRIFEREAKKMGLNAMAEIKNLTPVKTGTLRRRFKSRLKKEGRDLLIEIYNNTEYGPAVNYGRRLTRGGRTTGRTSGVHFLENGLENYRNAHLSNDINNMIQAMRNEFRW